MVESLCYPLLETLYNNIKDFYLYRLDTAYATFGGVIPNIDVALHCPSICILNFLLTTLSPSDQKSSYVLVKPSSSV